MLIQSIREMDCSKRAIRKTGFAVGVVSGIIGCLLWWQAKEYYLWFLGASATLVLLAALAPTLLKPFHRVWMTIAMVLGFVMTRVILGLFFYLVFTPIALLKQLFGKDSLNLKPDARCATYWIDKKEPTREKSSYERQF